MTNYIILAVFVVVVALIAYKYPQLIKAKLLELYQQREADVVQAAYNKLSDEIKALVDSKTFAEIIALGINVGSQIIDDKLNNK